MPNTTTLSETIRTLDGTEWVRLATPGANWRAQLSAIETFFGLGVYGNNTVLYGNGTSTIQTTNAGITNSVLWFGSGPPTFTTTPTIATSVTCPTYYGGSATNSTLTLRGTSNVSPSGDTINFTTNGIVSGAVSAGGQWQINENGASVTPLTISCQTFFYPTVQGLNNSQATGWAITAKDGSGTNFTSYFLAANNFLQFHGPPVSQTPIVQFGVDSGGGGFWEVFRSDYLGRSVANNFLGAAGFGGSRTIGTLNVVLESYNINGTMLDFGTITASAAGAVGGWASYSSRGNTSSRTTVNSGDTLLNIIPYGDDGTNDTSGASIKAIVDGTPAAGSMPTRLALYTGTSGAGAEALRLDNTGKVTATKPGNSSGGGGLGYITGAGVGAAVTQLTSKTTSVNLNFLCGQITTSNSSLASGAIAQFTVNNNTVLADDVILWTLASGATHAGYDITTAGVTGGSGFICSINNQTGFTTTDILVLNF